MGRTTRRLSDHIREHYPELMGTGITMSLISAVTSHPEQTSHTEYDARFPGPV